MPSNWPNPEGPPAPAEPYLLFSLHVLGKGRLAVCKVDRPDTYDTVADIQNIMSHRNDLLRLYNASSMNFFYETSAQGGQGVIHLLNYSRRPASDGPLFYVKEPQRVSPPGESGVGLARRACNGLPRKRAVRSWPCRSISVYGAVELES